jgi:hypothetical protein
VPCYGLEADDPGVGAFAWSLLLVTTGIGRAPKLTHYQAAVSRLQTRTRPHRAARASTRDTHRTPGPEAVRCG